MTTREPPRGIVRVDSWKVVCHDCGREGEFGDWTIFGDRWYAIDAAYDADWAVQGDGALVLCADCGHRKVCKDENRACTRRDLAEADDGWMYCPDHIAQGMDA